MNTKNYLSYLLSPLELVRTKKVLQVNPTVAAKRTEPEHLKIIVYDYDAQSIVTKEFSNADECFPYAETPHPTWINVDGLRKNDVEAICNHYGIHYLMMEDILSVGQRPKMDDMDGFVFCVLNMMYFNEDNSAVEIEQISIILGKNFVISFQEDGHRDVFNPLREKLKINGSRIRQQKADFLFYSMLDMIVDNYFLVMEKLGDKIEGLEEDIVRSPNTKSLAKINMLRKEMIVLKRINYHL
jgi:magnesium transporter